jgi:hypothetical protein
MMQRCVVIVLMIFIGGCLHGSGTLPQQTGSAADTVIPGCYVGTAYLFVDSTVQGPVRRDFRQWLVLDSSNGMAGEGRGGGRLVVSDSHPSSRVTWEKRGDSVQIVRMTFPSAYWMLSSTVDGLQGHAHFTSDVARVNADGRRIVERSDWPARLQRTSCKDVPDVPSHGV